MPPWDQRSTPHAVPSDWKRRKAHVLERDAGVCHLCGHAGAEQVDHVRNIASGGTHDLDNLAPAHDQPCPTCGQRCHIGKTQAEAAAARAVNRAKAYHPRERKHPGRL